MAVERRLVFSVQDPRGNVKGANMTAMDSCFLAVVNW